MALPEADCCLAFSTRLTSPGATRYCFPPARMTAYIMPPGTPSGAANYACTFVGSAQFLVAARPAREHQGGARSTGKLYDFSVLRAAASTGAAGLVGLKRKTNFATDSH